MGRARRGARGLLGRPYFGRMDPEQEAKVVPGQSPARSRCQQQCLAAWARLVTQGVSAAGHPALLQGRASHWHGWVWQGDTQEARGLRTSAHGHSSHLPNLDHAYCQGPREQDPTQFLPIGCMSTVLLEICCLGQSPRGSGHPSGRLLKRPGRVSHPDLG